MQKAILIPNQSVGDIKLNDHIKNYADRHHEYDDEAGDEAYSCYSFQNTPVVAFVDAEGYIETLRCDEECLWNGTDLIGLPYAEFQKLAGTEPDEFDRMAILVGEEEQIQDVYDYDELGLQVWVHDNHIVAIMAAHFDDEDEEDDNEEEGDTNAQTTNAS